MKKNMRKALSWIMILCMVLSMVPAVAIQAGAAEDNRTVNGSFVNGQWVEGGSSTVSYDVDGTEVTLSKTAQAVEGLENTYDITLLLGPMYHLFTEEDKLSALREAVRVTKPGGIIFAAYCGNDATILQFCFLRGMLKDDHYKALVDPVTFKAASDPIDLFGLHRPEEIAALRSRFSVSPLHLVASDGYANYMRDTLTEMDEELYQTYLNYHFATCERPDMLGYSNHYLDIFRKE